MNLTESIIIYEKLKKLEEFKDNQENLINKLFKKIENLQYEFYKIKNPSHFIPTDTLCSSDFNVEKKTGLSFEEALVHYKKRKRIRRKTWGGKGYIAYEEILLSENMFIGIGDYLSFKDILAEDWEIVE